ncbi:uncharacterized protein [Asterias amurensis]|uniref:uncharacterized protein n=1 Tax=Asterias amurensis TaxID=7602 RepID=UPI003AB67DDA
MEEEWCDMVVWLVVLCWYGGDEAVAHSASVMVSCSCNVTLPCNITMAAQFYLDEDPYCYQICDDRGDVQCAYCSHMRHCSCSEDDIKTYWLCRTGNRAQLSQCTGNACTSFAAMPYCFCDIMIVERSGATLATHAINPTTQDRDEGTVFNHGLLTGLAVGGGVLLFLVLVVIAIAVCLVNRKQPTSRGPSTRRSTSSSMAPIAPSDGMKGVNNPTYDNDSRFESRGASGRKPSTTSYSYPYAPRLAASRQLSTSQRGTNPTLSAPDESSYYRELTHNRGGDRPPTYEDSESLRASIEAGRVVRQQPVYMELMRPSDRSGPRPPVDTYMY